MKIHFFLSALVLTCACLLGQTVGARIEMIHAPLLTEEIRKSESIPNPPEYIFFDPQTGSYVARYIPEGVNGAAGKPVIVPIRFRVETEVRADVSLRREGEVILYRWAVRNLAAAKYGANLLSLTLPKSDRGIACNAPEAYPPVTLQKDGPTAARQVAESPAVSRLSLDDWRFALMAFPVPQSLQPGSEVEGWLCRSEFLPGWTTLYAGGGQDTILPGAPFAVHESLAKVRPFQKFFQSTLTFAPKYPPEAPKLIVALDFLHGLTAMEALGLLDAKSTFVVKLKAHLQQIVAEEAVGRIEPWNSNSRFEEQLLAALRVSLPQYF
ncbi:MAG: hypothetical protein NW208_17445 [Bryobacter sp.]|nr:hypothetical protein [Bryobacter sp.]